MNFWNGLVYAAIPVGLTTAAIALMMLFMHAWRRTSEASLRKSPIRRNLKRPPGHSLREKIEDTTWDILSLYAASVSMPITFFAIYVSQSYLGGLPESAFRIVVSGMTALAIFSFSSWKLHEYMSRLRNLRLGYDAEVATAQELDELISHGYRVFHDVPMNESNIDHVVVGPGGLFTIETKAFSKRNDESDAHVHIDYGTNTMRFPNKTVNIPLDQVDMQEKWLSKTISAAIGESVQARGFVALPGWFISPPRNAGRKIVINPTNITKFFTPMRPSLSDTTVDRVVHQLNQLCSTIEPSYKKENDF